MKNSKKGFSLVECIVAIAVIVIITTAAITTFTAAQGATNKEWENYLATTAADASVSAFQSADNLDELASRLPDGVKGIGDTAGGLETVTPQAVPFAAIRAYEDGKVVKLFNHLIDVNNDSYNDAIATFNYGANSDQYNSDVHTGADSLDKSAIYSTEKNEEKAVGGIDMIDGNGDVSFGFADGKFKIKLDYGTLGLGYTGSEPQKVNDGWELSEIEKYFMERNMILGIPATDGYPTDQIYVQGYATESNGTLYVYVYKMVEQADGSYKLSHDTDSKGRWHAISIVFPKTDLKDVAIDKFSTKSLNVVKIQEGYVDKKSYPAGTIQAASYKDFKGENGETFTNFSWGGLPLLAYFCNGMQQYIPNYDKMKIQTIPQQDGKLIYTDYTLKAGTAKIDYALYKSAETKLYSDESNTLLYKYTGGDALSVLTSLGMTKRGTEGAYDKYQKVSVTVSEVNAGYFYYLPEGSSVGCFINAAYSDAWNGERKIQTWVMNKDDISALISKSPEEIAESLTQAPTYSYRKA